MSGRHQYVERESGRSVDERLYGDAWIRFLYGGVRERAPRLFEWLTSARASRLLAALHFDSRLGAALLARAARGPGGVDPAECLDPVETLDTPRKLFERRIRYWQCRPMPDGEDRVVSPCDARALVGSLAGGAPLFVKEKFFSCDELLGAGDAAGDWREAFRDGDFALFRLTPERYHWNHAPVSGRVAAFYELTGAHHACNPSAVVEIATPYSKNRRSVTVIDTDVPGGSGVGWVAMVEVVALMIGVVEQAYCAIAYEAPQPVRPGLWLERGQPKSRFRPGSSTVVLLFERGRVRFSRDLVANRARAGAASRYAVFGTPLVETDVRVRSPIAAPAREGRTP